MFAGSAARILATNDGSICTWVWGCATVAALPPLGASLTAFVASPLLSDVRLVTVERDPTRKPQQAAAGSRRAAPRSPASARSTWDDEPDHRSPDPRSASRRRSGGADADEDADAEMDDDLALAADDPCVREVAIPAHALVLAVRSPYFAAMLGTRSRWLESSIVPGARVHVPLTRYPASVVRAMLRFMYTDDRDLFAEFRTSGASRMRAWAWAGLMAPWRELSLPLVPVMHLCSV